jgi:hypothetical protein
MKHPSRETLVSYLYNEVESRSERQTLQQHLAECADCQAQLSSWKTVRQQLDTWSLPPRRVLPAPSRSWVSLAAAAVVLLAAGLALGRYTFPTGPDLEALSEGMRQEIHTAMTQANDSVRQGNQQAIRALLADFALLQEDRRQEDLAALALALRNLETQYTADYASLRRDLETVAVLTDASFRQTQDQMVHLASLPLGSPPLNTDQP